MPRRRFLVALAASAAACSLPVRARDGARRIAMLIGTSEDQESHKRIAAFEDRLRELGWKVGEDVIVEPRWAAGNATKAAAFAKELLAAHPDLIVAHNTMAVGMMLRETRSIPIIFASLFDPAKSGFVTNFAHPEGNVTGFFNNYFSIGAKWLEILKEIAPQTRGVNVLFDPRTAPYTPAFIAQTLGPAADHLGLGVGPLPVMDAGKLDAVITQAAHAQGAGMVVMADPFTTVNRRVIVESLARNRVPAVYPWDYFVAIGGLASYGVELKGVYQRVAEYADRVLRGEKVASLPVQSATTYKLALNLKTARDLGLTVPPSLRLEADDLVGA